MRHGLMLRVLALAALVSAPANAAPRPAAPARGMALPAARPAPPRTRNLELAGPQLLVVPWDDGALRVRSAGRLEAGDAVLGALLSLHGLSRGRALGPRTRPSAPRFLELTSDRPDFDPLAAAAALRATGAFRAVCPNYGMRLFATMPDDFYLPIYQWHIDDSGDGDVDLPEAWDLDKGGSSIVIGIMDTGVDLGHPDLAGQIAVNPDEIPGNSIDDDDNGLVDDVTGYDFGNDDPDPNPEPIFDEIGLDIGFHGTFVAGVAAAATDNTEGIAGAGWNCRLLPLKVSNGAGELTVEAITGAFAYAADRGVSVLNMSFGGHDRPGVPEYFQALVDMADAAGVLCVAAAGNDGADSLSYPAACDRVLSVGATDIENMRAEFSNFGSWVRVAAPGASIWSSICRNYTVDDLSQLFYFLFFGWDGENPYMFGDGTSFACPLTAGVCGLVRHRFPTLTPQQTLQHVLVTGDSIAYDQPIGPKLNAFRAVSIGVTAVGEETPSALAFARGQPNPFRLSTALRFNTAAAGPVTLGIYDTAGRLVRTLLDGVVPAGPHASVWDGADTGGEPVAAGLYFARLESGGRMVRQTLVRLR